MEKSIRTKMHAEYVKTVDRLEVLSIKYGRVMTNERRALLKKEKALQRRSSELIDVQRIKESGKKGYLINRLLESYRDLGDGVSKTKEGNPWNTSKQKKQLF